MERDEHPGRPANKIPVQKQQVADFAHHHGGDGVIMPGQAKTRPPHQQRQQPRHAKGGKQPQRRRQPGLQIQQRGHIAADAEIQRMPQRNLPAIAAQNIPRLRQPGEQHGDDDQVLGVHILDRQRQQRQRRQHDHPTQHFPLATAQNGVVHHIFPNRPRGRKVSTSKYTANTPTCFNDGSHSAAVKASTSPISTPATSAPSMLPKPPSATVT